MHLSEGVLHTPTLIVGYLVASIGVSIGLRRLESQRLPLVALFSAVFFIASTIHIPVGVGSVHLILNGLAGLLLGWAVFPAFLIALVLQILFFSFGGFAVLGINLCIMALPALAFHYMCRTFLGTHLNRAKQFGIGAGAGIIGVGGAGVLAAIILAADGGKQYTDLIALLWLSHIPVFILDSIISFDIIATLTKMLPHGLGSLK
ncbi:cobalamin biosynthesis protein CbiM [[Actinobacillus] muris]|uniref:Cobalamin biosynthesis protein CbiM n=1 Tax=Muribacter muris TaxID=67855 RepID=A0A0J5S5B5_9PAST|nr:cobalt transporter CbiM [Muribacter muris]KMK52017.1 cobalamin biosynthesis protein CbiM [[Actinobacillus] muris] [Muribacter muris]